MKSVYHIASLLLLGAAAGGCKDSGDATPKKVKPAHVAHHVEEQDLNTITLTEKAEERLGIVLGEVQMIDIQRKCTLGGEVTVPPGQTRVVSAPLAGTLYTPDGAAVSSPGRKLVLGQQVFELLPLLSPERDVLTPAEQIRVAQTRADIATAQLEAERQVESAKVRVETAQIAYDRAAKLLVSKAGSQRSVDEAEANLRLAKQAEVTAEARHKLFLQIVLDEAEGNLGMHRITAPVAGVLQSIDAAPGEIVVAGAPLFHVVQIDRVWIRVPVYVGQRHEIDIAQDATIAEYGQPPDATARSARYVAAPPSADRDASTVDLFYGLSNDDGRLYPGQKLAVTLSLNSPAQSLVVPFNAVLYDIHGGAWVYEQVEAHAYARRRVAVKYVVGPIAVLSAGPQVGAKVVTDGAAELFGTEFGVGH
jgi:RND family efflux transporter MFP subunit